MERLAVHAVGQASKRGLIPRLPAGERLLADVETWLRAEYPEAVRWTRCRTPSAGEAELLVALHPAAQDVALTAADTGLVTAWAVTEATGPGYHTFVCRVLQRLAAELGIAWAPAEGEDGSRDDTGYFFTGERAAAERAHLGWLSTTLTGAREARRRGARGLHLGTPRGVNFAFEGALATALGPRDDAWLARAVGDPRTAIEVIPWWADATDARYLLNRALCLMWADVRWRGPISEREGALLDEVLHHLRQAHLLDPSLPYPWREWQELLELRGGENPMGRQVEERAAATAEEQPPIGYRRRSLTIIHEGWALEVPGSFEERRTDEEWWGGEGGRGITLAATETGTNDGPMSAEGFLERVAGHLGSDVLTHRAGEVLGRARLSTDGSSGVAEGVLEGYSAVTGKGAAVRVVFDDPGDWQWAFEVWRTLVPV